MSVQHILGINRYATVWIWLHKFRQIMVLSGREKLSGVVEVDETFVGGKRKGKRGRALRDCYRIHSRAGGFKKLFPRTNVIYIAPYVARQGF